jgi:hypothetical protein
MKSLGLFPKTYYQKQIGNISCDLSLKDCGTDICLIQLLFGHMILKTTARYMEYIGTLGWDIYELAIIRKTNPE